MFSVQVGNQFLSAPDSHFVLLHTHTLRFLNTTSSSSDNLQLLYLRGYPLPGTSRSYVWWHFGFLTDGMQLSETAKGRHAVRLKMKYLFRKAYKRPKGSTVVSDVA
ncbi:hypothetical protein ATANTOWER_022674 [Ataeniobius toweri]|uniref:Uncharacterized protein n=1 Tax=Ataeniobius toweri TaxID=208326 RepID=A0ABU7CK81_9TELE|nr:hypothetical protein [Ataeniobius toweri]